MALTRALRKGLGQGGRQKGKTAHQPQGAARRYSPAAFFYANFENNEGLSMGQTKSNNPMTTYKEVKVGRTVYRVTSVFLGESANIECYCDDGYSGRNFNRPGFKQMLTDAKKGVIDLILRSAGITKGQFIRTCAMATLARFFARTSALRPCAVATIKSPNETGQNLWNCLDKL
jgi:hypothetical protein